MSVVSSIRLEGCVSSGCCPRGLPEGLGLDFLPVVWMISVIQTTLTHVLIGQFSICALPVSGYFESCLLDSWVFRGQHFLSYRKLRTEAADAGGGGCFFWGDRDISVYVFGWLKAGWGVSSQMLGLQLAGWVGGELHWKAAVPAKWGLARHWEEIIHISSASSSSSQPPAEQHNTDPEHEYCMTQK